MSDFLKTGLGRIYLGRNDSRIALIKIDLSFERLEGYGSKLPLPGANHLPPGGKFPASQIFNNIGCPDRNQKIIGRYLSDEILG